MRILHVIKASVCNVFSSIVTTATAGSSLLSPAVYSRVPANARFGSRHFTNRQPYVSPLIASVIMLFATSAHAANGGGYSAYFVPGTEQQIYDALHDIRPGDVDDINVMRGGLSITAGADNTTVYYDHWENGYTLDPADPAGTADFSFTLNQGQLQVLTSSDIPTPRVTADPINECTLEQGPAVANAGTCFDGGDQFYTVGGAVTVSRISWNDDTSTFFQVAWEIYPIRALGPDVVAPFGEDLATADAPRPAFPDFNRSYLFVMAVEDGTQVQVNGAGPLITLNKGETHRVMNNNTSASIISNDPDKPLYGLAVVGDQGATYESRGFTIVPKTYWNTNYYAPAKSTTGVGGNPDLGNEIYMYNPQAFDITIDYEDKTGNGTFTLESGETHSYFEKVGRYIPVDSAVYLAGSDIFWGVVSVDTQSSSWDWGHALIPDLYLKDDYLIGWAPGTLDETQNGSPLYITPTQDDTDVFVDYAPHDGTPDQTFTLNRLDSQTVYDTAAPFNLSGAHVWSTNPIAVVYGEQAANGSSGANYLDLGYTTLPLRDEWLDLAFSLKKTAGKSTVGTTAGQLVNFTLELRSYDGALENIGAIDVLPAGWSYVAGTATVVQADGTVLAPGAAEPAIAGQELKWGLGTATSLGNLGLNEVITIRYDAITTIAFSVGDVTTNFAEANSTAVIGGAPFVATDLAHVTFIALGMCFAVADGGVDSDGDSGAAAEDALVMVDPDDGSIVFVGDTGTFNIEAIAFVPDTGSGYTLYTVNDSGNGQFGTLDLSTGAFTQIGSGIGSGSGAAGTVSLDDVDGLSYDVTTNTMYAVERESGLDLLFQIDIATGSFVPGAFAGDDYVQIPATTAGEEDVDDIAIEPYTGTLYASINNGTTGGTIVILDKLTGAIVSEVGATGQDDIEGLAFFNNGLMYGSSGDSNNSNLYVADVLTGANALVGPMPGYHDYEALGCLTVVGQSLGNIVFNDLDLDGQFDAGEELAGTLVELFEADGVTPATDFNGDPVASITTTADGSYDFVDLPFGDYVVQVTPPAGYVPTPVQIVDPNTDIEDDSNIASQPSTGVYQSGIVTLSTNGEPDAGVDGDHASSNQTIDFGFVQVADLQVVKTASPDPVQIGQNLTYTLTVSNSGPSAATGVVVTDNLPSGVTHISTTPSQGGCSDPGGVVCELGNIANGGSATVTIVVTVN